MIGEPRDAPRFPLEKYFLFLGLFLWSPFLTLPAAFAQDLCYVQAPRADIHARPSVDSDVLGTVTRGESLEVLEEKGNWLFIRYRSGQGFVLPFLVATQPPLEKKNFLRSEEKRHFKVRASSRDIREKGTKDPNQAAGDRADFEALKRIESFQPTREEVQKFKTGE